MGKDGHEPDHDLLTKWLHILAMQDKVGLVDNQLTNVDLSAGQRKRLAMLLAIAEEKSILLLDEWAADQDPNYRRIFYQRMIPMLQQMGKTLFVISHDEHYFAQADRLLAMRDGVLVELVGDERAKASQDAILHLQS